MIKFVCENCNYKIKSKDDYTKKACPYCGRFTVIKEPSAEDLIENCSNE